MIRLKFTCQVGTTAHLHYWGYGIKTDSALVCLGVSHTWLVPYFTVLGWQRSPLTWILLSLFLSTCNFLASQSVWNSKVLDYLLTYNYYPLFPLFLEDSSSLFTGLTSNLVCGKALEFQSALEWITVHPYKKGKERNGPGGDGSPGTELVKRFIIGYGFNKCELVLLFLLGLTEGTLYFSEVATCLPPT